MPALATKTGILFDRIQQFDPDGGNDFYLIIPIVRPDGSYSAIALTSDGDTSIYSVDGAPTVQKAIALTKHAMLLDC